MVGAMSVQLRESLQRMSAAKNLTAQLVNVVAALSYTSVALHRVSWPAASLIATGSLAGGWLNAHYRRRLAQSTLRVASVAAGLIGLDRLLAG